MPKRDPQALVMADVIVPTDEWTEFADACKEHKAQPSTVLRALISSYNPSILQNSHHPFRVQWRAWWMFKRLSGRKDQASTVLRSLMRLYVKGRIGVNPKSDLIYQKALKEVRIT